MIDIIFDTVIDVVKILPFLWVAFFVLELMEHKLGKKTKFVTVSSGRLGPLVGGVLGAFPQCGFSVMVTNLFVSRIVTLGTLISVYLATSDEMLPIMIAHGCDMLTILRLIGVKVVFGIISGFVIDFIYRNKKEKTSYDLCNKDHCHCEEGLVLSSFIHALKILSFIFIVSFGLNILMYYGGENILKNIFHNNYVLAPFLASLIGLIPNCGASVVLTELYLENIISYSSAMAGLLTGSGVALLVLFRFNKDKKENFKILLLIYFLGVFGGFLLEVIERLF